MKIQQFRRWLTGLAAILSTTFALAAVDINKATEAELDGIKGLGPATTEKILRERQKAPFQDWADLIRRVGGVGKGSAARLSAAGLTVNNSPFQREDRASTMRTAPTQDAR